MLDAILTIFSAATLLLGLFSKFIKERLFISEALLSTLIGIAIGPIGLGLVTVPSFLDDTDYDGSDLASSVLYYWSQAARLVMSLQIMSSGTLLPKEWMKHNWKSLSMLLGPVMLYMWLISGLILYLIFPISVSDSLIIGACISPTDPILVNNILHGKFAEHHISWNIREIISAESGANDGFAIPYLYLPLLFSGKHHQRHISWYEGFKYWVLYIVLWQTIVSLIIGSLIGWLASKALKFARSKDLVDKDSFLAYSIALALNVTGSLRWMGSNDLLAVFATGVVFAWDDWFVEETKEARIQEVIDLMLTLTFFVMYGILIPWKEFNSLGYGRLTLMTMLILLIRRLPILLALYKWIPCIHNGKEALFTGWFGPIGVGGLYYSTLVLNEASGMKMVYVIVNFCVFASILIHGVTMPLFHLTISRVRYFPRSHMSSPILPHPQLLDEEEGMLDDISINGDALSTNSKASGCAMTISEGMLSKGRTRTDLNNTLIGMQSQDENVHLLHERTKDDG